MIASSGLIKGRVVGRSYRKVRVVLCDVLLPCVSRILSFHLFINQHQIAGIDSPIQEIAVVSSDHQETPLRDLR